MSRFARWYVLLGVVAALPAATLLGTAAGELLRQPRAGLETLLQREGLVIASGVLSVFAFRTASGLRDERTWGLHLAMGLAGLLTLAGLGGLVFGGALMEAMGLARELVLGTVPLSLGASLLGARLLVGLWPHSELAIPLGRRDVAALGALVGVLGVAVLSHVLVTGLAS
jgi:hypothetical protein